MHFLRKNYTVWNKDTTSSRFMPKRRFHPCPPLDHDPSKSMEPASLVVKCTLCVSIFRVRRILALCFHASAETSMGVELIASSSNPTVSISSDRSVFAAWPHRRLTTSARKLLWLRGFIGERRSTIVRCRMFCPIIQLLKCPLRLLIVLTATPVEEDIRKRKQLTRAKKENNSQSAATGQTSRPEGADGLNLVWHGEHGERDRWTRAAGMVRRFESKPQAVQTIASSTLIMTYCVGRL